MPLNADDLFMFDTLGYLHLRGALSADEVGELLTLVEQTRTVDVRQLNADDARLPHQLNRPVSRMIDAEPRFAQLLDHPAVVPALEASLGADYRHIDNDLYFTVPGFAGGSWHRGVRAHPTGHVVDGAFICPMVKVFYCLTDVGPGQGEFAVLPGSHKSNFEVDQRRLDLPGQHCFDDVRAGDVIIFNEALIHNGRPNPSDRLRITLIVNFGRADAGPWPGYEPAPATLAAVSGRQRRILTPGAPVWREPVLA